MGQRGRGASTVEAANAAIHRLLTNKVRWLGTAKSPNTAATSVTIQSQGLWNEQKRRVEYCRSVQAAKNIVIIGGGAVGTEIAGEIATDYKDKEVTLIHPRDKLVSGESSDAFQKRLKEILQELGVKLVLGERVTNLDALPTDRVETATVTTDKGTEIPADLVIPCTGLKVNSMAYKDSLASSMEDNGSLKVNNFFEVQGTEGIYAIGDCSNIAETKMAYRASMHSDLLAKNILAQETGGTKKEYKPDPFIMVVSVGRKAAIGQKGTSLLPEFVVRMMKARDMMTGKFWKEMGQKPPR